MTLEKVKKKKLSNMMQEELIYKESYIVSVKQITVGLCGSARGPSSLGGDRGSLEPRICRQPWQYKTRSSHLKQNKIKPTVLRQSFSV